MAMTPYPADVTDEQWAVIGPLMPPEKPGGAHRAVDMREVFNGINYLVRTGCQWRAIPHDLPKSATVRHYYDRFRSDDTWEKVHDTGKFLLGESRCNPSLAEFVAQHAR